MYRSRHPLLYLLMALLIAAAPLQGVFAVGALIANDGEPGQASNVEVHHPHHVADGAAMAGSDAAGLAGLAGAAEQRDSVCDCCPGGQPGGCNNCAVTHCATHQCASAAVLSLVSAAVFSSDDGVWQLRRSPQLPSAAHSTPFRPPRG